jgi:hypothetical protein
MEILIEDETVSALRAVCDRHFDKIAAGHVVQGAEQLPRQFIREILGCLPDSLVERVSPPALGADGHFLTVRISPLFNVYVASAAKYLLVLCLRHSDLREIAAPQ